MMSGELLERSLEKNKKNILSNNYESPESNSYLTNKKEKEYDNIPIIKRIDISNKKISTSSLPSDKKKIYDQKFIKNNSKKKNIFDIYTAYNKNKSLNNNNSCPILILNNFSKTKTNKFLDKNTDNFNQNLCMKTFYKNNRNSMKFILDKNIKLLHKIQSSEIGRNKKNSYTYYDSDYNDYYYHKLFDRKLPLNELRFYRKILLNQSKGLKASRASSQYLPHGKEIKIFKNRKNSGNSENSKNTQNFLSKNSNSSSKMKNEENNDSHYEKIELGGVSTKVMVKFPKFEKNSDNENKNEDFHNIIKHPFTVESFGYKYMKNLKDKYKIYKNPLDDKDLIIKIKHLIINPNTIQFRNDNLMFNSKGFYKRKNSPWPGLSRIPWPASRSRCC